MTASNQYDSFGNPANTTFPSRYQFTGREYDSLNGLYYYRARMYDPVLGRFISEDPIGFDGGDVNLYGYVHSNPTNKTDPFGLIDPIVYQDPRMYNPSSVTPSDIADAMDQSLERIKSDCACDVPLGYNPLIGVTTLFGVAHGTADLLRIGNDLEKVVSCDENAWGRAAFALMEIRRFSGLFAGMAGTMAGRVGTGRASSGGPKPSPKFQTPTNPPQMPPRNVPDGWRVREMPPTQQYPNGYWSLEKPMKDGSWQPIDPSTMKPGGRPQTHVEFPPQ